MSLVEGLSKISRSKDIPQKNRSQTSNFVPNRCFDPEQNKNSYFSNLPKLKQFCGSFSFSSLSFIHQLCHGLMGRGSMILWYQDTSVTKEREWNNIKMCDVINGFLFLSLVRDSQSRQRNIYLIRLNFPNGLLSTQDIVVFYSHRLVDIAIRIGWRRRHW